MPNPQILITGGTGGLGVGVTSVFLAQGAELIIPYRSRQSVERLKGLLAPAQLARIRFLAADMTDEASVEALFQNLPRLDALVHLVGGFSMGKTHEYSYSDWQRDFDLNLNTTFLVCKQSLKKMLDQDYGRIVTLGSRGAIEPVGQLAAYCASKAGVIAFTRAIAAETRGTNITANVVLPSVIDTPSNRAAMGMENVETWVKPESLAKLIWFLSSPAAKDLRGAVIPVYGNA
jgi:NAD(P)-dependent dehydrogenase (short-subunit alcohol dehydrogenase family)